MLSVKLDYYDEKEKSLFSEYPNFKEIESLVGRKIDVTESEFLTYMVFKEQKDDVEEFRTFEALKAKIDSRWGIARDYIDLETSNIRAKCLNPQMDTEVIQRVGVAVGLCVINKLHNLTEADWSRLPVKNEKNMDFQIAVDNNRFILLETKGSTVKDNTQKTSSIRKHKYKIKQQKAERRNNDTSNDTSDDSFYYGTITAVDEESTKCWLVDPEPPYIDHHPAKYKLLSRLNFYWHNLRVITPNSTILLALINRIKILEISGDYKQYDGLTLVNRAGETIQPYNGMFSRLSVTPNEEVVGKVFYSSRLSQFFFVGFQSLIYRMLIKQDFYQIIHYRCKQEELITIVTCRLKPEDLVGYKMPTKTRNLENGYVEFEMKGKLWLSSSGRAFGLLDFNSNEEDESHSPSSYSTSLF